MARFRLLLILVVWQKTIIRTINHWTADYPGSEHPRAFDRGGDYWGGGNAGNNTYWMQKTNYIRLKNVEIGYNLPKELLAKTGIHNPGFR